ncbi:diguanylate cyclase domain-containing protein, partial [Kaarinaea lacus]
MEPLTDLKPDPVKDDGPVSGKQPAKPEQSSLEFEQVDLVYHQSFLLFAGAVIALLILFYALSLHIDSTDLVLPGVALLVLYLARIFLSTIYKRQGEAERKLYIGFWKKKFLFMTFLTGLTWGLSAMMLMPASLEVQVYMTLIIGGLCAAATVSYSLLRFAGLAFIVPAILPVAVFYFQQANEFSISYGILCLVYLGLLSVASNKMHDITTKSMKYANDNRQLINELQYTNRVVVQLNQDLHHEVVERRQAEDRFKRLSDASSEGVILHNQGIIIDANQRLVDMLGYSLDELVGTHAIEYITADTREIVEDKLLYTDDLTVQVYAQTKYGKVLPVEVHGKNVPFGEMTLRVVLVKDLSQHLEVESALNIEKERAMVTLESIGDGVVTTNRTGVINYINPVAEELSGWHRRDAIGKHLADILRLKDQNSGEVITDPVANCLISENKIILSGDVILQGTRSMQQFSIEVTISPIRDSTEAIIGTVLVFHDVTVLHTMARQMSHQATHDALTGLINRQEFEHRLNTLLESARQGKAHHAMCYLDLDEFKVVNDTSGHAAGDQLLQEISARLEDCIRESDTLARLGG